MINNFQIEIIRQFEIQKGSLDALVGEYLIDDSDDSEEGNAENQEGGDQFAMEDLRSAFKDAADDIIFYNKYSAQTLGNHDHESEEEDQNAEEEFDNGYYF